ncbi:hypothetical protein, partial [Acidithiobacillus thiooxidans]|uniref:hypothetical protein n=1 Tax=Acidithiobacillus thiooxidans TaxID=930 RepID=UPI00054E7874
MAVLGTARDAIPGLRGIVLPGKDLTKRTYTDSPCLIASNRTDIYCVAQAKIIIFFNTLTIRRCTDLCWAEGKQFKKGSLLCAWINTQEVNVDVFGFLWLITALVAVAILSGCIIGPGGYGYG